MADTPQALGRDVRKAAKELHRLDKPAAELGAATVQVARRLVPVRSGRLRSSIAFDVSKDNAGTQVTISAGGGRAVYAPVIHNGWRAHHIQADPFVAGALHRVDQRGIITQAFADRVDQVLKGI